MESEDRKLHPLSPLFILAGSIKQFALPLIILLFTGRGDRNEFYSAISVGLLATYSIAQYFTFRFRIERDGVVIRSGMLHRSVRHVPFARIQNVSVQQNLFHRLAGVAEVELESAGGAKPEGRMRVLAVRDVAALEALVREHAAVPAVAAGAAAADGTPAPTPAPAVQPLLTLDNRDLFRLGFISNRGILIVGAVVGTLMQALDSDAIANSLESMGRRVFGWSHDLELSGGALAVGITALVVVGAVVIFALSILMAFLQYDDFRLTDDGKRLRVERGLFTRVRGSLLRRRIQAFTVREGILHRRFGTRSLRVDSAASIGAAGESASLHEIAPIAPRATLDGIVTLLLEGRAVWPPESWQRLHPKAWRRRFFPRAVTWMVIGAAAYLIVGNWGLVAFGLVPIAFVRSRLWANHAAFSEEQGLIVMREGWLDRRWRFAELSKLQGVLLRQSPFDRRHGMATVAVDTAGAGKGGPSLTIPYLPEATARELVARITARF